MGKDRLTIMVSSTVYGIEELLERIYTLLTGPGFGYEVWMSHKGTMPIFSTKSAFENCIHAVEECDLFLGLITPHYGSGVADADGDSITHRELLKAQFFRYREVEQFVKENLKNGKNVAAEIQRRKGERGDS